MICQESHGLSAPPRFSDNANATLHKWSALPSSPTSISDLLPNEKVALLSTEAAAEQIAESVAEMAREVVGGGAEERAAEEATVRLDLRDSKKVVDAMHVLSVKPSIDTVCAAAAVSICLMDEGAKFSIVAAHLTRLKVGLRLPNACIVALVMFAQQLMLACAMSWQFAVALGGLFACKALFDEKFFVSDLCSFVDFSVDEMLLAEHVSFKEGFVSFQLMHKRLCAFRRAMLTVFLAEAQQLNMRTHVSCAPRLCTVLVVDGHKSTRDSHWLTLMRANPQAAVIVTTTAAEAVASIWERKPDLLLLEADLGVSFEPNLVRFDELLDSSNSGFAVVRALRDMEHSVVDDFEWGGTLVAFTTHSACVLAPENAKSCNDRGVDAIVPKPLTVGVAQALQAMCWSKYEYCSL